MAIFDPLIDGMRVKCQSLGIGKCLKLIKRITKMEAISLSKYRIKKDLREQEIYQEIKGYKHKDTLEEMRIQENILFIKYTK